VMRVVNPDFQGTTDTSTFWGGKKSGASAGSNWGKRQRYNAQEPRLTISSDKEGGYSTHLKTHIERLIERGKKSKPKPRNEANPPFPQHRGEGGPKLLKKKVLDRPEKRYNWEIRRGHVVSSGEGFLLGKIDMSSGKKRQEKKKELV